MKILDSKTYQTVLPSGTVFCMRENIELYVIMYPINKETNKYPDLFCFCVFEK
jgi:hypothetical protein